MANVHIHSIIQQAYTYQIHSTVFKFWIRLQIFAFLPSHFWMEVLSLKTSQTGLIILWHKSAPFPTFPISENKNTIHYVRNLCSYDSSSLIPHIHLIINFHRTCLLQFFKPILTHTALDQGDISCLEDSKTSCWHHLPLISPLSSLPHHHQS